MKRKLEISSQKDGNAVRVSASGEVDMEASPRLLEAIRAELKQGAEVRLDLKGVTYMDSSGIAVLVQGVKLARKEKAGFTLVELSPSVFAVIKLSQLLDFFSIERSGGAG